MYTFHYQVTEDDHFEYRLCHNYTAPAYRKKIMMNKYLSPALFMVWAIILGFIFGHSLSVYIFSCAISIVWIVSFRKRVERNIRKSLKLASESGKSPFIADVKMSFDDEKFAMTSKDVEASINYSAIEKIVTGPNALYLYVSASTGYLLPYRMFASEEEKVAFLQFIKQKTNAPVIAGVSK